MTEKLRKGKMGNETTGKGNLERTRSEGTQKKS